MDEQREALKKRAIIELCRQDFYFYTRYIFKQRKGFKWKHNWHHKKICDKLMEVHNGNCKRLIINIPPRYSKTDIVIISFITWSLGKNPDSEFIHPSYSKTLATLNSWQARSIVQSEEYQEIFPDVVLRTDSNKKDEWRTTRGGCVYATGTEGTITGYGAGKMRDGFGGGVFIDDPHKAGEANSIVKRQSILDWFSVTLESRLNSLDTPIVIIMQRLHEEDLAGWLLDGGNEEEWEHLLIPALNEKGEPLWEWKQNKEELLRLERSNSYVFAGQYMQSPAPIGGGMFKDDWWKYYNLLPKIKRSIVVGDTAMKAKEQHDYSVFMHWGEGVDGNAYLIDLLRGKWEAPELEQAFVAFYNKCKHNSSLKLQKALIEDKASGTGLIQSIKRKHKIPISGIQRNREDKVQRAMGVIPYIESGYVFLPKDAHFLNDLLAECRMFPNGKNDDQIDTISDALDEIFNKRKDFRARVI